MVRVQLNQSEPLSPVQSSQASPPGPRRAWLTRPLRVASPWAYADRVAAVHLHERRCRGAGARKDRPAGAGVLRM